MEFTLEFFANDRYDILKLLCDNQVKVKDAFYVTLSQQEIADMAHFSKLKTNRIINELLDEGYLFLHNDKRGKYALSEKGLKCLRLIQNNNI